jgi:hypothetical protein
MSGLEPVSNEHENFEHNHSSHTSLFCGRPAATCSGAAAEASPIRYLSRDRQKRLIALEVVPGQE